LIYVDEVRKFRAFSREPQILTKSLRRSKGKNIDNEIQVVMILKIM